MRACVEQLQLSKNSIVHMRLEVGKNYVAVHMDNAIDLLDLALALASLHSPLGSLPDCWDSQFEEVDAYRVTSTRLLDSKLSH